MSASFDPYGFCEVRCKNTRFLFYMKGESTGRSKTSVFDNKEFLQRLCAQLSLTVDSLSNKKKMATAVDKYLKACTNFPIRLSATQPVVCVVSAITPST